jgi:Mrp family chromosome partitioning ATPase
MSFREILSTLWRRWLTVVAAILVAVVAAGAYFLLRTPSYQAVTTIEVQMPSTSGTSVLNIPNPLVTTTSSAFAADAQRIAGDQTGASVSSAFDPTSDILSFTATGPSASGVAAAANAYGSAYVNTVASLATQTVAKINGTLTSIDGTINRLEAQDPTGKNPVIQAQITANTQNYATLASEQSTITLDAPYASVQAPGVMPTEPTGSGKAKIGGVAVLAGLLAGIGIALVREQFDTGLRSDVDVKEITGHPVLAELPFDNFSSRSSQAIAVIEAPHSALSESIRELRTSLRVLLKESAGALVMVTSPAPGDGKTTVIANLGAAWAMMGRSVIVVSADFRRPRIEKMFAIRQDRKPGLAQLAQFSDQGESEGEGADSSRQIPRREDVAKALVTTDIRGLSVLTSGGIPRNPSELFDSPAMTAILDHLAALADVVLLDAPPVLAVTDPAILGRSMTGVVVVVSEGDTGRQDLEATVNRLDSTGSNVLGIAINRTRGGTSATRHPYYLEATVNHLDPLEASPPVATTNTVATDLARSALIKGDDRDRGFTEANDT